VDVGFLTGPCWALAGHQKVPWMHLANDAKLVMTVLYGYLGS
jgi:hypothetical protein